MLGPSDPPAWRCVHCHVFSVAPHWLVIPQRGARRCPACGGVVATTELNVRLRLSRESVRWLPAPPDA